MNILTESRFIRALYRQPVDKTPIWLMRQAGRYLPEYRALRQKEPNFLKFCQTPSLACEATLQPLARFPLDAAIIFSDILTIPHAYGMALDFIEGEGPCFQEALRTENSIYALPVIDPEQELRYVMDAIRMVKKTLDHRVPLIGFAGSPWTIATYMVEGKSSKSFSQIKKMLYGEPQLLAHLLAHLSASVSNYLIAQIEAGVDAVMVFDTWGGVLSQSDYLNYSLKYMEEIVKKIQSVMNKKNKKIPIILFSKGVGPLLAEMAKTGCDALGVDWTLSLKDALQLTGKKVALQGNIDPAVLYAEPNIIQQQVAAALESYGHFPGHIFNLGHGMNPDMDPEKVAALVECVHTLSVPYHQSQVVTCP
jgi:uroporphyrinogen decarboxylase